MNRNSYFGTMPEDTLILLNFKIWTQLCQYPSGIIASCFWGNLNYKPLSWVWATHSMVIIKRISKELSEVWERVMVVWEAGQVICMGTTPHRPAVGFSKCFLSLCSQVYILVYVLSKKLHVKISDRDDETKHLMWVRSSMCSHRSPCSPTNPQLLSLCGLSHAGM